MEKQFKRGEVILAEGDTGTQAFVIVSGQVEISCSRDNKKSVLGVMGPGHIFGEMSMIDDSPRSATVTALEDTVVQVIERDQFNAFFYSNPDQLAPFLKNVFERMRHLDKKVIHMMVSRTAQQTNYLGGKVLLMGTTPFALNALNDKELELTEFPFKIGRKVENHQSDLFSHNDLYLDDEIPYNVSRNHLSIQHCDGKFMVIDRGSTLGTVVNGERIGGPGAVREIELPPHAHSRIIVGSPQSPFQFKIRIP